MASQRTKKSIIIGVVLTVFVVAAVIVFVCFFVFRGKETTPEEELAARFLSAYSEQDPSCAELLLNGSAGEMEFSEEQTVFSRNLTYEIQDSRTEGDYAMVTVEIQNINFAEIMEPLLEENSEGITEGDILSTLQNAGSDSRKTYSCEVVVYQGGVEDKIMMTEDLSRALLGGLNDYMASLLYGEGKGE